MYLVDAVMAQDCGGVRDVTKYKYQRLLILRYSRRLSPVSLILQIKLKKGTRVMKYTGNTQAALHRPSLVGIFLPCLIRQRLAEESLPEILPTNPS